MQKPIRHIAIIGGGSAGWLSAAILASKFKCAESASIKITLIESDEFASVGVGEGTWPTMRETIHTIGIDEKTLIRACDVSFKQGSQFNLWRDNEINDSYLHPFTPPRAFEQFDLTSHYLQQNTEQSFAESVCFQTALCQHNLAPKLGLDKNFQGFANYGYHLDASKFAALLKHHCTENLNVTHLNDTVENVELDNDEFVKQLHLKSGDVVAADLFIDCSGFHSLLLDKTYGIGIKDYSDVLLVNHAIATQQPYPEGQSKIASQTLSTAQEAGWIWDIGLSSRRGVGYVYNDTFISNDQALESLARYLNTTPDTLNVKHIKFQSGHREKFWHKNVIGIGLSAGFIEPLEASALMMIELSAKFIAEQLPPNGALLPIVEKQFNQTFTARWESIVDFLRLHYQLSERTEPFWQASRSLKTLPQGLNERLTLWQYRPPINSDFMFAEEMFPAASYQYILYGMNFQTDVSTLPHLTKEASRAAKLFELVKQQSAQALTRAQANNVVINQIKS